MSFLHVVNEEEKPLHQKQEPSTASRKGGDEQEGWLNRFQSACYIPRGCFNLENKTQRIIHTDTLPLAGIQPKPIFTRLSM